MAGAVDGGDDEVAVGPLGVFVSVDQKFVSELVEVGPKVVAAAMA